MDTETIMRELADKDAIRDLIHRYCRAVDRLDVPLGRSVWHEGGVADYGEDYYRGDGKGVIDKICADHARMLSHSHQVANILIEIAGNRAGSESYVSGTMRALRGDEIVQIAVWGRYCDQWEKREGHWGLVRRTVVFDHEEIRIVTPMEHCSRGARDLTDPSYAAFALEAFQ